MPRGVWRYFMALPWVRGIVLFYSVLALLALWFLAAGGNPAAMHTSALEVIPLIAGIVTMAALSFLERFASRLIGPRSFPVQFDEAILSQSVGLALEKRGTRATGRQPETDPQSRAWEIRPGDILGVDKALALALLRIEIERELRRIAFSLEIDFSHRPVGAARLLREIADRHVLPPHLVSPLREVLTVCNAGLHGEYVPGDTALAVVRVGGDLVEGLRQLPLPSGDHPSEGPPSGPTGTS